VGTSKNVAKALLAALKSAISVKERILLSKATQIGTLKRSAVKKSTM
jgi:hypothetical protein